MNSAVTISVGCEQWTVPTNNDWFSLLRAVMAFTTDN